MRKTYYQTQAATVVSVSGNRARIKYLNSFWWAEMIDGGEFSIGQVVQPLYTKADHCNCWIVEAKERVLVGAK